MGDPPITVAILIGLGGLAVLVCIACAVFAWRAAWPIGMRRVANELRERVELCELDWTRVKGQLDVRVEEMAELEETIERKRARVAARESWAKKQQGEQPDDATDRRSLIARARAKGYQV